MDDETHIGCANIGALHDIGDSCEYGVTGMCTGCQEFGRNA